MSEERNNPEVKGDSLSLLVKDKLADDLEVGALEVIQNLISSVKGIKGLNNGIKVTGKKGSKAEK
ncbi:MULTISPECIES: hypothetical protein [unclassified Candidatus Frackibacter]|uniref:hypothetical protein n=1 Tax=unclassified Candidatus Frackibacter TaxID=2648818 RepID=UPI000882837D|nr:MULTISPECIES: hypothetical protein [unclassified Candidatus Frackibacter]SDB97679.1 hypothetical protein SAMN04515661_101104 [Candidatus Frackibacter sp. WG11]SEM29379.1 hypothetical protein SAMN04488698_101105 [Candidatus Frackibacter sp. WG12]SFL34268.1 hypothetical protein SAMN04488699_101106 [Candidatus Frackibacter sp. WG13]